MNFILVVACALVDADKRVLIAQRPEGKTLAGLWEFPGGKVEPGERPETTLIRELHEEIGITVNEACLAPLTFASHAYDDFHLADAALHLPALGRRGDRARAAATRLGPRQQIARLSDAGGRHSPDPAFDRFVDVRSPDRPLLSQGRCIDVDSVRTRLDDRSCERS